MIPHNAQAERTLIAQCLLDNSLLDRLDLDAESFADNLCYEAIKAALGLRARGLVVDLPTLAAELPGRAAELAVLSGETASAANSSFYLDRINAAARSRLAARIASELREGLETDPDEAIERACEALGKLAAGAASGATEDRRRKLLEGLTVFSAQGEQAADLPPRTWFIDGMLTPGLNILSARKGLGKSFFALQAAAAIAAGGTFLGRPTTCGKVLYAALELDRIAMHERTARLPRLPDELDIAYSWPRGDTAIALIEAAIIEGGYNVIILDMIGGILPEGQDTNSYDLSPFLFKLRRAALDNCAAVLALHHSTKADSGDHVTNLMGSTAFGGQADSIIAIERRRGEPGGRILISGNHGRELALDAVFEDCRWSAADREEGTEGPTIAAADRIYAEILEKHPEGLSASLLAATAAKNPNACRAALSRLARRGLVLKRGTQWHYSPPNKAHEPNESARGSLSAAGQPDEKAHRTAPAPRGAVRSCAFSEPRTANGEGQDNSGASPDLAQVW